MKIRLSGNRLVVCLAALVILTMVAASVWLITFVIPIRPGDQIKVSYDPNHRIQQAVGYVSLESLSGQSGQEESTRAIGPWSVKTIRRIPMQVHCEVRYENGQRVTITEWRKQ